MNRDKRLGLALGVLLVGIVAAFFFRNEPAGGPEPPLLENPKPLNDRIAERPAKPYLREDEPAQRPRRRREPSRARVESIPSDDGWSVRPDDDHDAFHARPTSHEIAANPSGGRRPPPQPIPIAPEPSRPASAGAPEHNREWSTEGSARSTRTERTSESGADWTIHEVRPGETLSGLALKYLGSQHRYDEILEANRDRLRDPKALRSGMKIRIPKKTVADRSGEKTNDRAADRRGGRDSASDRPVAPSPKRTADDRRDRGPVPSRNTPARSVTLGEDGDDKPFGSESEAPSRGTRNDESSASPRGRSDDTTSTPDVSDRNPFLPADAPARQAGAGRSLSQRRPEDLPAGPEIGGDRGALDRAPTDAPRGGSTPPTAATSSNAATGTSRDLPATTSRDSARPDESFRSGKPAGASGGTSSPFPDTSKASASPRKAAPADPLAPGRYLVQRGDTLERIARRLYGDPQATDRILKANADLIESADDLREGMSLRIPLP